MSLVAGALVALCAGWVQTEPPELTGAAHVGTVETGSSWEIAGGKARVHMVHRSPNYMGMLEGDPGLVVPEHQHDDAVEMLYVIEGAGYMVVAGKRSRVEAGMMIQVPRGVKHSFMIPRDATSGFKAVQVYTPAGPEQRFEQGRRLPPATVPEPSGGTPDDGASQAPAAGQSKNNQKTGETPAGSNGDGEKR